MPYDVILRLDTSVSGLCLSKLFNNKYNNPGSIYLVE